MVGHLGTGPFGQFAKQRLDQTRLHQDLIQQDSTYTTGLVMILVTGGGERTMLGHRGSNSEPISVDQVSKAPTEIDWMHVSGYTLVEDRQWASIQETLHNAKQRGVKISLDPGMYTTRQVPERILSAAERIDELLVSDQEIELLFPERSMDAAIEGLLALGTKAVVVKLGAKGSRYIDEETYFQQPAIQREGHQVIDTTGAGDVFNAGYLFGRLTGLNPSDCLLLGNALGYLKVTSDRGAAELSGDQDLREQIADLVIRRSSRLYRLRPNWRL